MKTMNRTEIVATYDYYTLEQAEKIFRRKIKKKVSRFIQRMLTGSFIFLLAILIGVVGENILPCAAIGLFFAVAVFKEGTLNEKDMENL